MGGWSFTNIGASATPENKRYIEKIFEYIGYAKVDDKAESWAEDYDGKRLFDSKTPGVYGCEFGFLERDNKKPAFSKLYVRELLNLLNALFPKTSVYVYQSDGSTVTDSFVFHEKVFDVETMTCKRRDKTVNYGGWGSNKEETRTESFTLGIPDKKYVEALVELSAADGNTELTALLLELTRKLREGFEDNAASFLIEGGVLKIYRGLGNKVNVPDGVTSIGNEAFAYCKSMTGITLPEGVTSIGDRAFYGCAKLKKITLPDRLTSIGDRAFYDCKSLKKFTPPESLTSIGDMAFEGCTSLTSVTLPEGVTSIGNAAFYGCESLTSITLPDGVTSIGDGAFKGCKSLTIHAPAGSYAEKYAKENKIRFEATE